MFLQCRGEQGVQLTPAWASLIAMQATQKSRGTKTFITGSWKQTLHAAAHQQQKGAAEKTQWYRLSERSGSKGRQIYLDLVQPINWERVAERDEAQNEAVVWALEKALPILPIPLNIWVNAAAAGLERPQPWPLRPWWPPAWWQPAEERQPVQPQGFYR